MKPLLSALLFTAASCVAVHADPSTAPLPGKLPEVAKAPQVAGPTPQSLERLADLAHVALIHDAMLAQLNRAIDGGVAQALHGETPTATEKADLDSLRKQVTVMIDEQLGAAKLKAFYAKICGETLTQEQVDGLSAFYSTPVGQVFTSKQLEMNTKMGMQIQGALSTVGMKLQYAMYSTVAKIRTAHAPKPAPKAAAPAPAAKAAAPVIVSPVKIP